MSGGSAGGRSCSRRPRPRSRRGWCTARRWRHRVCRNPGRRAHPPADRVFPSSARARGAGCARVRRCRAAGRACARCPASSAVRSCCRRAPSTGRSGSNAACRAGPAASRRARPAPRSPPSDPEPRRAAGHSSPATTRSTPWPARPPPGADHCVRAATRSCPPGLPPAAWPPRGGARPACAAIRPRGCPARDTFTISERPRSMSCFSQLMSSRCRASIRSRCS